MILLSVMFISGFPHGSVVKNLPANSGDTGWIPGSGRSAGEGYSNPFPHCCLENPTDRRNWEDYSPWCTKSLT